MHEIKCPSCGKWNQDSSFCSGCGTAIGAHEIRKIEIQKKKEEEAAKPPEKIDVWIEKGKHHRFLLVRATFYVLFSIWAVFMAIGSFAMWLIAWSVG